MSAPPGGHPNPVFVSGSTLRHVMVMTATGSVGLVSIFIVDFISLYWVSRLGDPAITAAAGLGTTVLFLTVSINVGLSIAITAGVARLIGARRREEARRAAGASLAIMGGIGLLVTLVTIPLLPSFFHAMHATPDVAAMATRFLVITLPSNAVMVVGMGLAGLLRAVGDARRAMYVTLAGGVTTAIFDPILIIGLGLGLEGAAIAIVIARTSFILIGWWGAVRTHDLVEWPTLATIREDLPRFTGLAMPIVLTNIASPIALTFMTGVMASYGKETLAASAIIDRVVPMAFGVIFALSGSVGPILSQNWGAGRYDRVRRTLKDAFGFVVVYSVVTWLVLILARDAIPRFFGATGETADLVAFMCVLSGPVWICLGMLFVANSSFNNLGFPFYATAFNWGRATLGTIPFALGGAWLGGAKGAQLGFGLGAMIFGIAAVIVAFRTVRNLEARDAQVAAGGR